jgi:ABC-type spermidine/putrescine transport system permease subunit II
MRRSVLTWLSNPWARARFLWAVAIAYVAWALLPVVVAILFSFNGTRSLTSWQGFSTQWYAGNENSVWQDPTSARRWCRVSSSPASPC